MSSSRLARIYAAAYTYQYEDGFALYHPQYASEAADHIANGHSPRAAAGAIRLDFESLERWMREIPDFTRQVKIAVARRVFELEKRLLMTRDGVRAKVLLAALRRAAPEAWDDPRTSPHDDGNRLPTVIETKIIAAPEREGGRSTAQGGVESHGAAPPTPADIVNTSIKPNAPGSEALQ